MPAKRVEGDLQLFDRRQVEVVGRLVEHEQVDLAGHQHGERRPRPLARRQRRRWSQDVVGDEAELGEQRAGVAGVETGDVLEHPQQGVVGPPPSSSSRACSISPTTTLRPRCTVPALGCDSAEDRVQQRRLAGAVGADEGDPLTGGDQQVDRTERERRRPRTTTSLRRATTSPLRPGGGDVEAQLPRHPRLVDDVQALHRPLRARRPAGELLGLVDLVMADELVALVGSSRLRQALGRPLPLALGPAGQAGALGVVLLEALPGVTLGGRLLVEVGLPAAAEPASPDG